MDDDAQAVLQRHAHALGDEETAALRSARVTRPVSAVACADLLGTYFLRAKMLRRFSSAHAERLRRDVEAMCVELARSYDDGECAMWAFELPSRGVVLVEHVNGALLGVLHTVGREQVESDEDWTALWGPEDRTGIGA